MNSLLKKIMCLSLSLAFCLVSTIGFANATSEDSVGEKAGIYVTDENGVVTEVESEITTEEIELPAEFNHLRSGGKARAYLFRNWK